MGSARDWKTELGFTEEYDGDGKGLDDWAIGVRGDFCGVARVSDTSRFNSKDAGFFGGSGVGDLGSLLERSGKSGVGDFGSLLDRSGDFAGVSGLSFKEFLAGVRSTGVSLGGSELGNTCSVLTNGTLATGATFSTTASCGVSVDFFSLCFAPGARLLGPRALPLVM